VSSSFVTLAAYLAPSISTPSEELPPSPLVAPECDEAISAARRFRAGVSDAADAALPEVLSAIAHDVLGRELQLAPAEIAGITAAAIDRFGVANVLSIQAHPSDLEALRGFELECTSDPCLQRGDVRMHLRSGTIDLALPARLDAVLAAWR
jgi:flagellar biosynthesis/type III secretory pathway protein FliH